MSHTVWKYSLQDDAIQDLAMPEGATILHVGEQRGRIFIWVHCDPTKPVVLRRFLTVATGRVAPPLPDGTFGIKPGLCSHVGTVVMSNGEVWHIFEKVN